MKSNEPETDGELEDAIAECGYSFEDRGGYFVIRHSKAGGETKLAADNLSDALFEAWNLVKP